MYLSWLEYKLDERIVIGLNLSFFGIILASLSYVLRYLFKRCILYKSSVSLEYLQWTEKFANMFTIMVENMIHDDELSLSLSL